MGFDGMYCPIFNEEDRDILYGEDPVKKFNSAFPVEFYLSSSMEYGGEREFFSKFGLEIKNNINVIISKRSFSQRVPQALFTRPREGDLIYVPFLNGTGELFEIKFVNQTKDFFMLGRKIPYYYELEMEKFKYSQERISTGVFEIDDVATQSAYTIDLTLTRGANNYTQKEIVFQSNDNTYANAIVTATVQNWSNTSNTLSVSNITGEFVNNKLVIGTSSNARHTLTTFDPLADASRNEVYDNQHIFGEANTIIDFSEINPFGSI